MDFHNLSQNKLSQFVTDESRYSFGCLCLCQISKLFINSLPFFHQFYVADNFSYLLINMKWCYLLPKLSRSLLNKHETNFFWMMNIFSFHNLTHFKLKR